MMRYYSIKWAKTECLLSEPCGSQDICPQDGPHLLRKKNKLKLRQVPKAAGSQGRWCPADSRHWRPGRHTLSQGTCSPTQSPTFCGQDTTAPATSPCTGSARPAMSGRHSLLNPSLISASPATRPCTFPADGVFSTAALLLPRLLPTATKSSHIPLLLVSLFMHCPGFCRPFPENGAHTSWWRP